MAENIDIYTRLHGAREAARGAEGVAHGLDDVGDEAEQAGRQAKRGAGGVDRFGRAAQRAERHSRRMGRTFVAARTGVGGLRAGIVSTSAALFGGLGLISGLRLLYGEASEATHTGKATAAVLKSTGANAWTSRKQIEALSTSLSELAGVDDEVVQKSANMLLTFRNIRNETGRGNKIFNRTQKAALDMAAGFTAAGKAMTPTDAALQLGKAVNDPIKGMTRLTRIGVTFTDQQVKQVEAMTKAGDKLGAQKVILNEINKEFGGQAKAQADPVKKLGVIWHNVAETLGLELLPYAKRGARWLGRLGKDIGQILGDKNYSAADKFHQVLARLFGDRAEQQIEHVINDFRQMGRDLWPLVKLGGGVARAIGRFAAKHPDLARVAFEILAINKAIGLMGFGTPIRGVKRLLGWFGKLIAAKFGAKVTGEIASKVGALPGRLGGSVGAFGAAGRLLGGALGIALVAELSNKIQDWFTNEFGSPLPSLGGTPNPGGLNPRDWMNPFHGDPNTHTPLQTGPGGVGVTPGYPATPRHPSRHGPRPTQVGIGGSPHKAIAAPAMTGTPVIHEHHHHIEIDGREIAHVVSRETRADGNRR